MPDDLAVRVRALRRARRDAQTRASRVRRVLLAPTAPSATSVHFPNTAPAETYLQTSTSLQRN
ncbi:hypothetical protein ETD83_09690 [Actinomadura soli]|uniref:Uncharacterized protein n=1 Tax=Actinomadura soli TaxID=2508997 RepID=A0A5C4JGH8_9ACTN|nr:hypothetical protein [Actinomadura soli]TMR03770.1 hypothetical protein ETD83_09690 [Actinomadura soli]